MRGLKRKKEGRWKRYAMFCLFLVLVIFLGNSTRKVYNKKVEAEKTLLNMQNEVRELKEKKVMIEANLDKIKTNEGMEFEIRKKFNVGRAGENVVIIVQEEATTTVSDIPISPWQKFKDFFANIFR